MIDIKVTPNKNQDKNTTSHKFKQDLVEFFHGKELESCLEIGTNRGYSTLILSQLFGWVTTLEINRENIEFAKHSVDLRCQCEVPAVPLLGLVPVYCWWGGAFQRRVPSLWL